MSKRTRKRKKFINSRSDPGLLSFKGVGAAIGVSLGRASVIFNDALETLAFHVFVELNGCEPTRAQVLEVAGSEAWRDLVRATLQKKAPRCGTVSP